MSFQWIFFTLIAESIFSRLEGYITRQTKHIVARDQVWTGASSSGVELATPFISKASVKLIP